MLFILLECNHDMKNISNMNFSFHIDLFKIRKSYAIIIFQTEIGLSELGVEKS